MVISAIFGGLVSLINTYYTNKNRSEIVKAKEVVQENSQKIEEVHSLTNGNLSKTQEELEQERRKTDYLEKLVTELTDNCPPGKLDEAKKNVEKKAAKIGKRRKTDLTRAEDVA